MVEDIAGAPRPPVENWRALGLGLLVLVGALTAGAATARTVTDSAGRVVEVPETVTTAFAAGPPAAILLYVLAPDKLLGWPRALRPHERPYIAPPYRDLPATGRLTGRGGEANLERVLALDPDVIIDFGSVRDTYIDLANRVQAQTGIPYLLIDGRFDNTAQALRGVVEGLGGAERGEALVRDVEATFARLDAIIAATPQSQRPRTYLARGPVGLESGTLGSINTEIIERAGGRNVLMDNTGRRSLVQVSLEQILVADPEVIITWDPNFFSLVGQHSLWAGVDAVRRGRVYLAPTTPFGWIDRPPSLNRLMGLRWLAGLFYPEQWSGDLSSDTRAFYRQYYHVELTDADLERLLAWAAGHPRP
ncbi:MAG: iron ABC transporter substrate-binding protein [Candidatus Competibacterales bacterium]